MAFSPYDVMVMLFGQYMEIKKWSSHVVPQGVFVGSLSPQNVLKLTRLVPPPLKAGAVGRSSLWRLVDVYPHLRTVY